MDIGDIGSLIFFAIIALSFLSGAFGRVRDKTNRPSQPPASDGSNRQRIETPLEPALAPAAHEQRWEAETLDHPERHDEEVRERYGRSRTSTYDDAIEAGDVTRTAARREQRLEQDVVDMPKAMDLHPEHRRRVARRRVRRRRNRNDAAILRGWLEDPDTLGRAFIVKEVLDVPVGMRKDA